MNASDFAIRLSLNEDDLRRQLQARRPVVCPIFVEIGSLRFPNEQWSDFPVVILGWWMEGSVALQSGTSAEAVFRFMEGPYELLATVVCDDYWAVQPFARERAVQHETTYVLRGSQVIEELKRASLEILGMCRAGGKWDKDCETLEKLVQRPL